MLLSFMKESSMSIPPRFLYVLKALIHFRILDVDSVFISSPSDSGEYLWAHGSSWLFFRNLNSSCLPWSLQTFYISDKNACKGGLFPINPSNISCFTRRLTLYLFAAYYLGGFDCLMILRLPLEIPVLDGLGKIFIYYFLGSSTDLEL